MFQVVALFAIVGGLAVDAVKQDHPEHLSKLIESVADVVEDELASWINDNGGWVCIEEIVPFSRYFVIDKMGHVLLRDKTIALRNGCVFSYLNLTQLNIAFIH